MPKINHTLRYIEIETCSACTRKCEWCLFGHYDYYTTRGNLLLEEEYIRKIFIELAVNNYNGLISLYSMNEPLLDERIRDGTLLKLGRSILGDKNFFLLTSNGDLLTDDVVTTLFNSGLSKLNISCYDDYTIEKFKKYTDWEYNIEIKDKRYFRDGKWEYNRAGSIDCHINSDLDYRSCFLPMFQSIIGWDGEVRLCGYDALGTVKLGNIKEKSYYEILASETFHKLRTTIRNTRQSIETCRKCNFSGALRDI